jgi:hypothetical protein
MNIDKIRLMMLTAYLLLNFSSLEKKLMAQSKNGFDLSNSLIPVEEIMSGGPAKDGIPAIDHPKFIKVSETNFLKPGDRVLGVVKNGIARAYPIRIMNWHEIVNDYFGHEPVVITYCPLCGSGVAFLATIDGETRTFGVSGLLYNNDVLLYDRKTHSLWTQIMNKAVSGPSIGVELQMIPIIHTNWADWKSRYPEDEVLSTETGYYRDYNRDPYAGYENSENIMFPLSNTDNRFHAKELLLGVEINGKYIAFPFSELKQTNGRVSIKFAGKELIVNYDKIYNTARVSLASGEEIPGIILYWFAWIAFHSGSEVYRFHK